MQPTFALVGLLMLVTVEGARILALIPYNARSHYIVMEPLLLGLRDRGHHLTVVSSFPQKPPLSNWKDIDLSYILPPVISNYTLEQIRQDMPTLFHTSLFIFKINSDVCDKILREDRVQDLLEEKFDLVIGEIFGSDCFNVIVHKLNAPLVSWVTSTMLPWAGDRMGLPDNPSYIPNYFVNFDDHMTFPQRVVNTVTLLFTKTAYYFLSELPSRTLAENIFAEKLPSLEEINRKTSLVLVNSHFSLTHSRPLPPNVVEVGGIHVRPARKLPQDLETILQNAKEGVILFSFGSLVRVASLPEPVITMFLEVFATLPQKVILKYEEDLPEAPSNVVVRKWLPQADLIGHSNVRVVVTHGGLASTMEAIHFAKPLVGVPFFSDQFQNIQNVVRRGAGVMLRLETISHRHILEAFKAVLGDPSYTKSMKRLSEQFRDRPSSPLDTALFWTEYVLRHSGAPQLQPASKDLPLYQYLLLDLVAVVVLVVLVTLIALFCACKLILRCLPSRPTVKPKKNTKKNAKKD